MKNTYVLAKLLLLFEFCNILVGAYNVEVGASSCDKILTNQLKEEIGSYEEIANLIIDTILSGKFKGRTYNNLAYFTDNIGPRLTGSKNLENGIDFILNKMKTDGLDNVHGEHVPLPVPYWQRNEENAEILSPKKRPLKTVGLGHTVATPYEGITASALVVTTFEELKQKKAVEVKGKIVIFNQKFENYSTAADYREKGPVEAAKLGAVACLVRSVTPFSLHSLHTGYVEYEPEVQKIPAASITVEDAQYFHRLQNRSENITIHLFMNGTFDPEPKISRNAIGELTGWEKPENFVIVSGHLDSWDINDGVLDDAGGCFISVEALALLKHLNLKPRRTLRTVLFTAEEQGYFGAIQYAKDHSEEMENVTAMFESDNGIFKPLGLDFAGNSENVACILQEILQLLEPINATSLRRKKSIGGDTSPFLENNVTTLGLYLEDEERYYWFHHTEADDIQAVSLNDLDLCLAVWTVVSYVIADLSVDLQTVNNPNVGKISPANDLKQQQNYKHNNNFERIFSHAHHFPPSMPFPLHHQSQFYPK